MSEEYRNWVSVEIIGLKEALEKFHNLPLDIDAALHDRDILEGIGGVLVTSARKTIDEGGRPTRYKPLAQSTINQRWNREQKKSPGQRINKLGIVSNAPLNRTGKMYNSLDSEYSEKELYLISEGYLKYHQFDERRTKARFPTRPVWGIQEEDHPVIVDIITTGVIDKLKGSVLQGSK